MIVYLVIYLHLERFFCKKNRGSLLKSLHTIKEREHYNYIFLLKKLLKITFLSTLIVNVKLRHFAEKTEKDVLHDMFQQHSCSAISAIFDLWFSSPISQLSSTKYNLSTEHNNKLKSQTDKEQKLK